MIRFWVVAALMAFAALAFMLLPLWRQQRIAGKSSWMPMVLALAVLPATVLLYLQVSTWAPAEGGSAPPEVEAMVESLAARLQQAPDNVEGWRLLGRSYMSLGRYADAELALREAWKRTAMPDSELKLALAEAQVLQDRAALSGEAGRLVEEVVTSEPQNMKALWYGGLVALETERFDVARARWGQLLALNPPPAVAQMLQQQLAQLGAAADLDGATLPTDASGAGAQSALELQLQIGLEPSLAPPSPGAALFIFARAPGGGPPVAVLKAAASEVPGTFTLSDANTMLPGRSLSDFEELTLVARISSSGQPIAQPGDLFGEVQVRPTVDANPISIEINQRQP
jgi:cytochrome c-type biogenesis protein CcmH